jgi:DNA invertase Pin-like site-specific DNA recombinase
MRKRRTPKGERGLPPDDELRKLARVYLDLQRKLWPDLMGLGILPEPTDDVLALMVQDFKLRHAGAKVEPLAAAVLKACGKLGSAYSRYSCENSRPDSVSDQLVGELRKAYEEKRFVPWRYVYADYAISGLDSGRRGYMSHKDLIADPAHAIDTVYIDDFTRASRDEIEWWRLASLIRRLHKRLRGASDNFDLADEDWDTKVTFYNLLTRIFLKSLRQKVRRGMRGAARRGHSLGRPALGYALTHAKDEHGNPLHGPDGLPIWMLWPDPESRKFVEMAFELYGELRWSMGRIAREFNRLRVDGGNGCTAASIRQLLKRQVYIGVMIYNRHRQERDPETGKVLVVENPRTDWEIKKMPHLRLVSDELWKKVRRRMADVRHNHPLTGKRWSRNTNSASTLFSGTLLCECCSKPDVPRELVLNRSAGKYKVMACIAGVQGRHGCGLRTSKSVRIIEDCLLRFLRATLLGDEVADRLVSDGNAFLAAEAARPRTDAAPLKAQAKQLTAKIDKLVQRVENEPDEELCKGYDRRVRELQRELNKVNDDLKAMESRNQPPPPVLGREQVLRYLGELRDVLNQEVPASAEIIRSITGPILISQKPNATGKRGATWIARFTPKVLPALAALAKERGYPSSFTLEFLSHTKLDNAIRPPIGRSYPERAEVRVGDSRCGASSRERA